MAFPVRSSLVWLVVALCCILVTGCNTVPSAPEDEVLAEDRDAETEAMSTEMLRQRGRIEPRVGVAVPVNSNLESGAGAGVRAQLEAVQKGLFFGIQFDWITMDSKDPIDPGTNQNTLLSLDTENLLDSLDRFQLLATVDYDIPLARGDLSPIFRLGLGVGGVIFGFDEAEGNTSLEFDEGFSVVVQPRLGFLFPFHESFGAFVDAEYSFIPELQITGVNRATRENVDIGDTVELSTINVWFGFNFTW